MPRIDTPETHQANVSKEDKVYVSIPGEDLFDLTHAPVIINGNTYEAGKDHYVSKELASEIQRIVSAWRRQQVHLLRPSPDRKAEGDASKSPNRPAGGGAVSAAAPELN